MAQRPSGRNLKAPPPFIPMVSAPGADYSRNKELKRCMFFLDLSENNSNLRCQELYTSVTYTNSAG